jgi:hypothetical protein
VSRRASRAPFLHARACDYSVWSAMKRTACLLAAALWAAGTAAQSPARPHPADARAEPAARPYESSFRDYRPYTEADAGRWREANESVGRLGGHAGHTRKADEAGPAPKPAAKGHAGHGGHK